MRNNRVLPGDWWLVNAGTSDQPMHRFVIALTGVETSRDARFGCVTVLDSTGKIWRHQFDLFNLKDGVMKIWRATPAEDVGL